MIVPVRTVRDWYADHQRIIVNGSPKWMPWQIRALSVHFDGRPLGEHPVAAPGDGATAEKIWEMDGAARTLVSADLDRHVRNLRLIPTAPPAQTPDFVATLDDGRDVAVEHTRVCSGDEKRIVESLDRIQGRASEAVAKGTFSCGKVAFAFPHAPRFQYVDDAVDEMLRALRETVKPNGTVREPFAADYPLLHELGVHWTVVKPSAPPEVRVEPWLLETDPQDVADEIFTIIAKKRRKFAAYRDHGDAVWLTVWVDVRFCSPDSVLYRLEQMVVEHLPFEKIIVGCSTRAVVFDGAEPRYHQDFG